MIIRLEAFLDLPGPVRNICFHFPGGYNRSVNDGCGEYLTNISLWNVCASRDPLSPEHHLRLLIRYAMCIHFKYLDLRNVRSIGIVNPRLNCTYMTYVGDIPNNVLHFVKKGIVGYGSE